MNCVSKFYSKALRANYSQTFRLGFPSKHSFVKDPGDFIVLKSKKLRFTIKIKFLNNVIQKLIRIMGSWDTQN